MPPAATLTAGAANEFQIEGHMAEEAGNEYQNLKIDNIAITVYATQLAYESDSYGPDYDEEAVIGTYIELGEGEDLLAALASAEAGQPVTIKLMGNVEWPTEGHHGENDVTPASAIVINGNGYTITATGAGVTPIGDTEAPMTLKNVKIVDKSVSYKENAWEFTYLEIGGTKLNCENVTFADEIQFGTNATFTNCTFESNEESVYAVWVEDGNATFINCAFTGYRGIKVHEDYGSEVKTVVVDNCTFKNITKKPGMAIGDLNADTTVAIKDSKFVGCQAGDQGLYIYETDTDVTTFNFVNENNTVTTPVATFAELKKVFEKGGSVELTADIAITELVTIPAGVEVYLDMNGKTITPASANVDPLFDVKKGAALVIDGNGTFDLGEIGTVKGMSLMYPRGDVTINSGTFKIATNGTKYGSMFVGISGGQGKLIINGGYFDGGYYKEGDCFNNCRNLINGSWGQYIRIYGGTFVGQNPAWGDEGMAFLCPHCTHTPGQGYCQALFLEGQSREDTELPEGYTITEGTTADGRPTYTVNYSK